MKKKLPLKSPKVNTTEYLSDLSDRDKPWDRHKYEADAIRDMMYTRPHTANRGTYINQCSSALGFHWDTDSTTGETKLKLKAARFCRVRHCPICEWRKSLMWRARFYQEVLPRVEIEHPQARWVFMTLTVKNCEITELRRTIQQMNKSWTKFKKRKEFASVLGWVRTTEVTKAKDGKAHPHFHVLMMVKPSYFGKGYVTQDRWTEVWKSALKADYTPIVNVKAVKNGIGKGVTEVLKYSVKPADMTDDLRWFQILVDQVHRLRFVATGGVLKDCLKTEKITDEDLIHLKENPDQKVREVELWFDWLRPKKRYAKRS